MTDLRTDRARIRAAAVKVIDAITSLPPYRGRDARTDWLAPPPLSVFRHLEPIGFGLYDDDDRWVFNPIECTPEVLWPVNVGIALGRDAPDDKPDRMTGLVQLLHVRTIVMAEARGYARRFSRYMARVETASEDRGIMWTAASVVAWLGNRWTDAQDRVKWHGPGREEGSAIPGQWHTTASDRDDEAFQPALAIAIALRQRYEWSVSLGFDGSPTIRFATDPTGIKELWRVRDLPEGRDRRPALHAWVEDHWRQHRLDPDMEIYVRQHLRGARRFTWRDMIGEIIPSQFDVEKRDRLIRERQAMRIAGTDRRPNTKGGNP